MLHSRAIEPNFVERRRKYVSRSLAAIRYPKNARICITNIINSKSRPARSAQSTFNSGPDFQFRVFSGKYLACMCQCLEPMRIE